MSGEEVAVRVVDETLAKGLVRRWLREHFERWSEVNKASWEWRSSRRYAPTKTYRSRAAWLAQRLEPFVLDEGDAPASDRGDHEFRNWVTVDPRGHEESRVVRFVSLGLSIKSPWNLHQWDTGLRVTVHALERLVQREQLRSGRQLGDALSRLSLSLFGAQQSNTAAWSQLDAKRRRPGLLNYQALMFFDIDYPDADYLSRLSHPELPLLTLVTYIPAQYWTTNQRRLFEERLELTRRDAPIGKKFTCLLYEDEVLDAIGAQ